MAELYRKAEEIRQQLLEWEEEAASDLQDGFEAVLDAIQGRLEKLASEQVRSSDPKRKIDVRWLIKRDHLTKVRSTGRRAFRDFAFLAAVRIKAEQAHAARTSFEHAHSLVSAAYEEAGRGAEVTEWRQSDGTDLVGRFVTGEALTTRLSAYWPEAETAMIKALNVAAVRGQDLSEAMPEVRKAVAVALARVLTVNSTEPLRVHRETMRRALAANRAYGERWSWTAFKEERTCIACLAMDGREFRVADRLEGHVNCRCMMVPVIVAEVDGEQGRRETGAEWFAKQSPERKKKIVGDERYQLMVEEQVELSDFVERKVHPTWGASRQVQDVAGARRAAQERSRIERMRLPHVSGANYGSLTSDPERDLKKQVRALRHYLREQHRLKGEPPELDEQDVIELGKLVAKAAESRFRREDVWRLDKEDDILTAPARWLEAEVPATDDDLTTKEGQEKYQERANARAAELGALEAAAEKIRERRRRRFAILIETMAEVVQMGVGSNTDREGKPRRTPPVGEPKWSPDSKEAAQRAVSGAFRSLPRRWLRASANLQRRRDRAQGKKRGVLLTYVDPYGGRYRDAPDPPHLAISLRHQIEGGAEVKSALDNSAYHEAGHRVEHAVPAVRVIVGQFFKRRTHGRPFKEQEWGQSNEIVRFYHDVFYNDYAGRAPVLSQLSQDMAYPEPPIWYYEVLSMGLEGLRRPDVDLLYRDPEHAYLVLGLMVSK